MFRPPFVKLTLIALALVLASFASARAQSAAGNHQESRGASTTEGNLQKAQNPPTQSTIWPNADTLRPVAVICDAPQEAVRKAGGNLHQETAPTKGTPSLDPNPGFQTIPLAPGQNPAGLCGKLHLSDLVYRIPVIKGLPPPCVSCVHAGGGSH
jgi:hypothetical protein